MAPVWNLTSWLFRGDVQDLLTKMNSMLLCLAPVLHINSKFDGF